MEPVTFIYQQTIIQFRIPIYKDGTAGFPEITRKFTSDIGAPKKKVVKKKEVDTFIGFTEHSEETI